MCRIFFIDGIFCRVFVLKKTGKPGIILIVSFDVFSFELHEK